MRFDLQIQCNCNGCLEKVKQLRQSIQGVDSIAIDKKQGIATISGTVDPDTVMKELAKVKVKSTVLLWDESQPVPPNKQVPESCHNKHQAAQGNASITVTLDPNTLKKEHEEENKKTGSQQKSVQKIEGRPSKDAPQPAKGNAPIIGTLDPHTLTKEHKKENKKAVLLTEESQPTNHHHHHHHHHQQLGLQQQPVKKPNDRLRKKAPQPGLDESTRKRTLNCCQKSGHKLELKPKSKRFTCIGCKEEGFGPRYRCDRCDYDFHKECTSPKETTTHELFKGSTFKFLSKSDKNTYTCDACVRKIYGCSYHCKADSLDMHPCCSNLKGKLCIGGTDFILRDKVKYKCLWCKKKKRDWIAENKVPGWSYVSKEKRLCCHVHCMWPMVFEAWKKGGFHGTDDDDDDDTLTMALQKIDLKVMANSNGNGGGHRIEILKSVGIFLRAIIGIFLGDPTVILTSLPLPLLVESISK